MSLFSPYNCPEACQDLNNKNIEDLLNSPGITQGEKTFLEYALKDPDLLYIDTEEPVEIMYLNELHKCKCDFILYFKNENVFSSEYNGIDHFTPRFNTKKALKDYKDAQCRFVLKQEQLNRDGIPILNINSLVNWNKNEFGFVDERTKQAYSKAVNTYTQNSEFIEAYNKLKNGEIHDNINITLSFNDIILYYPCGNDHADQYMKNLLLKADYKIITNHK